MPELTLIIIFLLLNSIAIFGFKTATEFDFLDEEHPENGISPDSKMILWKVRYYSLKYFGYFWSKPICLCPPCMASVHSTYFYAFFLLLIGFQIKWILFFPMYVLILSGVNYFIAVNLPRE